MGFEWMEDIPLLRAVKSRLFFRKRLGDVLCWLPKAGIVPKPPSRPRGISVYMTVKNEAVWIETTLRSLSPFVDQFSIVDNGSADETVRIVRETLDDLDVDYVLEEMPDADFADVKDRALHNTTHVWALMWDGDIIARTQGGDSFEKLRSYALSLDPGRYFAVAFPHVQLDGDLYHQNPERPIHYEPYLTTYSPKIHHARSGRFREIRFPYYYKRLYVWDTFSFHIWGLDPPEDMIRRSYWEAFRLMNTEGDRESFESFVISCCERDYGTSSLTEAGALYCRDRFRALTPYDTDKYGGYPDLLKPFLETLPLKLVRKDGRIVGRTDIMDMLERLDEKQRRMSVDVIVPTRGRPDMATETVRHLLKQDYPRFRVLVIDQNDEPIADIADLAVTDERLVHHPTDTRGLPVARNVGLGLSEADIIIYVDDDIIPEPGFIEGHVMVYRAPSVGAAAGYVRERREEMNTPVPPERIGRVNYLTGEIERGFIYDAPLEIETAQGVNMSFKREALEKVGGFDTGYGGSFLYEETDCCLRVGEIGYRVRYTPDAALLHLGAPAGGCRLEDTLRQVYWYAHNFTLLFMKHFPRRTFPVWFAIRMAKFARDCVRNLSLRPLFAGIRGMRDGMAEYRKS